MWHGSWRNIRMNERFYRTTYYKILFWHLIEIHLLWHNRTSALVDFITKLDSRGIVVRFHHPVANGENSYQNGPRLSSILLILSLYKPNKCNFHYSAIPFSRFSYGGVYINNITPRELFSSCSSCRLPQQPIESNFMLKSNGAKTPQSLDFCKALLLFFSYCRHK